MNQSKASLLEKKIRHLPFGQQQLVDLVEQMGDTAFQARNLSRAAKIYVDMLRDEECAIILTVAGSMVSAGMKELLLGMIEHHFVDAIVATGANIVDQDFFEALGFSHYQGEIQADDQALHAHGIDRIYDTYIDEDDLRRCDNTICEIADSLPPRPYSSREFLLQMGEFLAKKRPQARSLVLGAYQHEVPIFCPAFSDCSAGFGLVMHQVKRPGNHLSIDSVKDFRELTMLKIKTKESGLLMLGGGVPKNFTQDVVVAAELLGEKTSLHKYAVQITVADERDGGLSGSTLKEACSWGKVAVTAEQMVFSEATLAFPLLVNYAAAKTAGTTRRRRALTKLL
jgi:deoxyhypusine synthase